MQKILLKAQTRTEVGKGGARSLRRHDLLPAILYSKGSSTPIKVQKKEVTRIMTSGRGEHALITLELSDEKGIAQDHWALVKDYQADPIRKELLHVDFMEISLEEKIKTVVPVIITKEPIGIKNGGILQQQLRSVEIECLPTRIPDRIEIDASAIDVGGALHVSDLPVKEEIKILTAPHEVILSVKAPKAEAVPVAAPVEEAVEPELIKTKGKEEPAEEEQKEKK